MTAIADFDENLSYANRLVYFIEEQLPFERGGHPRAVNAGSGEGGCDASIASCLINNRSGLLNSTYFPPLIGSK